jgi:hypothetical protein
MGYLMEANEWVANQMMDRWQGTIRYVNEIPPLEYRANTNEWTMNHIETHT